MILQQILMKQKLLIYQILHCKFYGGFFFLHMEVFCLHKKLLILQDIGREVHSITSLDPTGSKIKHVDCSMHNTQEHTVCKSSS